MNRRTTIEIAVFVALVSTGAALRVALRDIPNFAPVAAVALFSGYFFRSRLVALCVPLSIMLISDQFLPGYAWYRMAVVYGMLALPVFLRGFLRANFQANQSTWRRTLAALAGLLACSLGSSIAFFVVTNALCLGWYEPTWAGAAACYAAGIPFFKYTLAGDLAFALTTFGAFAAITQDATARTARKNPSRSVSSRQENLAEAVATA